ncbi:MAG: hypothetical protein IKO40_07380 [Kiritimatiellae bacterium]|nr:hypothetical protein [Kiritimatiellia bacterium]
MPLDTPPALFQAIHGYLHVFIVFMKLFLFFHRRINLAILIITSIAISFLVGICVHFHEKTIWRQRLGYIYMGNSIVLSGILEHISNEGVISYEGITNLENVVYSSTLIANFSDSKFTNDALWINHLSNIGTYLQNHKREEDSPVIVELKKVLHNQLINH